MRPKQIDRKDSDFWDSFSREQKKEIELAWKMSDDEQQLVSHEQVMREAKDLILQS
ncbi:MAG: hypothetical protein HY960_05715 [Ignavibacteriae bacterium]|nr:hypothetical protein [Ignavibacteriota bacterium]